MPRRTKKAAIKRMQSNTRLAEIIQIEPRIRFFIKQAVLLQDPSPFESRIAIYVSMRNSLYNKVGWEAEKPSIRTSEDYDVVLDTILDLLDLA